MTDEDTNANGIQIQCIHSPTFANHIRASLTSEPKKTFTLALHNQKIRSLGESIRTAHCPFSLFYTNNTHATWRPLSRARQRCVWIQLQSHPHPFSSPWPSLFTSLLPLHSQSPLNGMRSSLSPSLSSLIKDRKFKVSRLCPSPSSTAMLILA